jgi:hypothetical protein
MLIRGACHCGNISFSLLWTADKGEIPARACGCSFCRKHGGVWTSLPAARLDARLLDPNRVSRYNFGTRTADFYVCATCGAVPFVTSQIDGVLYAVVNVNTFDDVAGSAIRVRPASFDGEAADARLERRQKYWISSVTIAEGAP